MADSAIHRHISVLFQIQFVAYNSDLFSSFKQAAVASFGVIVISLLGQVSLQKNSFEYQ